MKRVSIIIVSIVVSVNIGCHREPIEESYPEDVWRDEEPIENPCEHHIDSLCVEIHKPMPDNEVLQQTVGDDSPVDPGEDK